MKTKRRSLERKLRDKTELLRVLAHPTRLLIIQKLAKGPKCVTDIQDLVDVQQANLSQHLSVLRSQDIVDYHEDGKLRCYYLTRPAIACLVKEIMSSSYPIVERSQEDVRRAGKRRKDICPA